MPHPGGRPRRITPHLARKIFLLAGYGLTTKQLCDVFDISNQAIETLKRDAEFKETLKREKEKADLAVISSLYKRACGLTIKEHKVGIERGGHTDLVTEKDIPPDTVACIFWLKNRQRDTWRDRHKEDDGDMHIHSTVVLNGLHKASKNLLTNGAVDIANGSGHRPEVGIRVD